MSFILETIGLIWKGPEYVNFPSVLPTLEPRDDRRRRDLVDDADRRAPDRARADRPAVPRPARRSRARRCARPPRTWTRARSWGSTSTGRSRSRSCSPARSPGAAGLVYALSQTVVRYDQGFTLGLIAFTAAVLGGIGNLPGAVLGALLIGLIQAFNEGLGWHAPGLGLDGVDRVHDPDPDPRLPSRRPPRRTNARGRLARGAPPAQVGFRNQMRARWRALPGAPALADHDRHRSSLVVGAALAPRPLPRLRRGAHLRDPLAAADAAAPLAARRRGRDRRDLRDRLARRLDARARSRSCSRSAFALSWIPGRSRRWALPLARGRCSRSPIRSSSRTSSRSRCSRPSRTSRRRSTCSSS